jgi:excisionase family DNA binding protein
VELRATDEFVIGVVARARELGLLENGNGAPDRWLTTEQAATYLGCSRGQVLNHVSAGRIPRRYQKGHKALFKTPDLDAFVTGPGPFGTQSQSNANKLDISEKHPCWRKNPCCWRSACKSWRKTYYTRKEPRG